MRSLRLKDLIQSDGRIRRGRNNRPVCTEARPCEDIVTRQPSASQEERLQRKANLPKS